MTLLSGPSSLSIYSNRTKNILFIGDIHTISPTYKNAIGINQLFDLINTSKPIAYITEGGRYQQSCDITQDCCLSCAQVYNLNKKKFKTYWCDFRYEMPTYDFHITATQAVVQLSLLNSRSSTHDRKIVVTSLKDLINPIDKIIKFGMDHFLQRLIMGYRNMQTLKGILPQLLHYFKNKILTRKSYTNYFFSQLHQSIGEISTLVHKIKNNNISGLYRHYRSIMNVLKMCTILENTIMEMYVLGTLIHTNYSHYIIHLGQLHIESLQSWMTQHMNYTMYFNAPQKNTQLLDISQFNF